MTQPTLEQMLEELLSTIGKGLERVRAQDRELTYQQPDQLIKAYNFLEEKKKAADTAKSPVRAFRFYDPGY